MGDLQLGPVLDRAARDYVKDKLPELMHHAEAPSPAHLGGFWFAVRFALEDAYRAGAAARDA